MKNEDNKFSNNQLDLFIKFLYRSILLQVFAAVKASLVVIYIIVVKNIIFTFQKSHHKVLQKKFSWNKCKTSNKR